MKRPAQIRQLGPSVPPWLHRFTLADLDADLAMLKLRHRRGHDLRCTMISLGRTDGARKDILELCTHTPRKGSAIDLYTTFPREALCEEVSKPKVQRRSEQGEVVPLRAVAGDAADGPPTENQGLRRRFPRLDRFRRMPPSLTSWLRAPGQPFRSTSIRLPAES